MVIHSRFSIKCKAPPVFGARNVVCGVRIMMLIYALSFFSVVFAHESGLTEVTLQLKWLHQFQFAGYYMAKENGYYEEEGLSLIINERKPDSSSLDSLFSGEADFAISDAGAVLYDSDEHPLVALAAIFQHSPSVLIVRGDAGFYRLSDLRGKKLRNSNGYNNAELMAMFEQEGMPISQTNIVSSNLSLDRFTDGEIDAINGYTTNEPYILSRLGFKYKLFHPRDYQIDFYGDILVTSEKLVKEKPELVEAFRAASLRGWQYAIEHPEETVNLILRKYNTQNKSREHLSFEAEKTIELILSNIVPIGYMNPQRWEHIVSVFEGQGKVSNPINLNRFIYVPLIIEGRFSDFLKLYYRQILALLTSIVIASLWVHNFVLRSKVKLSYTDLQQARDKAELDARTDALTELPNRRHFIEVLNRDLEHARRNEQQLSLVMVDIDNFKQINDRYGHLMGDKVLSKIGQFFRQQARDGDFAARFGGEEFILLYRDTSLARARYITERLRSSFNINDFSVNGSALRVTMSFGLTSFTGTETIEELIALADKAMYQAKETGKDKIIAMQANLNLQNINVGGASS